MTSIPFFFFSFCTFSIIGGKKKKKLHTTESSWCHESRGRMVSSSVGWQRLCAHSRLDYFTAAIQKLIGFFAICGLFFFFFSSTVFVSLKKRKLPRTYIISQCARHARWWEQLFLTNTVHLQPPTQALDKWWSYPAKNRYIAAPWIPNRLSLFSPSVLRHDACTVAARKVWCIVGKVIHWLREYLSIQAVRWSIVVAVGADKRPTVCVAGVQRRPWSFEKKKKKTVS